AAKTRYASRVLAQARESRRARTRLLHLNVRVSRSVVGVAGAEALDQAAVAAAVAPALAHGAGVAFAAAIAPSPAHGAVRRRSDAHADVLEAFLARAAARDLAALFQCTLLGLIGRVVVLRPAVVGIRARRERAVGSGKSRHRRKQEER